MHTSMNRSNYSDNVVQQTAVSVAHGKLVVTNIGNRLLDLYFQWQQRRHSREALAQMSDHMLKDIGISRYDAVNESSKPFWTE
jgi:uncharacterized protein YjiS (DUF1127 family)